MAAADDPVFNVIFTARGVSVGKMRNEVTLTAQEPFQTTRMMATDEGKFQGGADTAATPLEYFLTGLVGCLMTMVRSFSRRMKIPITDVTVDCRAHWQAARDDQGPFLGEPVGFDVDISVVSEESPERVADLVAAARRGCFVEQTLKQANTMTHRLRINDRDWTEV